MKKIEEMSNGQLCSNYHQPKAVKVEKSKAPRRRVDSHRSYNGRPFRWFQCANGNCSKWRVFLHQEFLKAGLDVQYECNQRKGKEKSECSCEEPGIWHQCLLYSDVNPEDGLLPNVLCQEVHGSLIDFSALFLNLQALSQAMREATGDEGLDPLEILSQAKKGQKFAVNIVGIWKGHRSHTKLIVNSYKKVFRERWVGRHSENLEEFLLKDREVIEAITRCKDPLLKALNLNAKELVAIQKKMRNVSFSRALQSGGTGGVTIDTMEQHFKSFLQYFTSLVSRHDGLNTVEIQELITALKNSSNIYLRDKFLWVGGSGAGKSTIQDKLLLISSFDRSRYKEDNYKYSLDQESAWNALEGLQDATELLTTFHGVDPDNFLLRFQIGGEIRRKGKEEKKEEASFILPTANPSNSTTSISTSIRRSSLFHVVLQFRSAENLQKRWEVVRHWKDKEYQVKAFTVAREIFCARNPTGIIDPKGVPDDWDLAEKYELEFRENILKVPDPLASFLGKAVVIAGRGENYEDDRSFFRKLLKYLQVETKTQLEKLPPPTTEDFIDENKEIVKRICQLTRPGIERIRIYVPSELATVEGELVDTPGSNDTDFLKSDVLELDLQNALFASVVCEKTLKNVESTCTDIGKLGLFVEIANCFGKDKSDMQTAKKLLQQLVVIVRKANRQNSEQVKKDCRSVIENILQELIPPEDTRYRFQLAKELASKVSVVFVDALSSSKRFVSLDPIDWKAEVASSDIFRVLGVFDRFFDVSAVKRLSLILEPLRKVEEALDKYGKDSGDQSCKDMKPRGTDLSMEDLTNHWKVKLTNTFERLRTNLKEAFKLALAVEQVVTTEASELNRAQEHMKKVVDCFLLRVNELINYLRLRVPTLLDELWKEAETRYLLIKDGSISWQLQEGAKEITKELESLLVQLRRRLYSHRRVSRTTTKSFKEQTDYCNVARNLFQEVFSGFIDDSDKSFNFKLFLNKVTGKGVGILKRISQHLFAQSRVDSAEIDVVRENARNMINFVKKRLDDLEEKKQKREVDVGFLLARTWRRQRFNEAASREFPNIPRLKISLTPMDDVEGEAFESYEQFPTGLHPESRTLIEHFLKEKKKCLSSKEHLLFTAFLKSCDKKDEKRVKQLTRLMIYEAETDKELRTLLTEGLRGTRNDPLAALPLLCSFFGVSFKVYYVPECGSGSESLEVKSLLFFPDGVPQQRTFSIAMLKLESGITRFSLVREIPATVAVRNRQPPVVFSSRKEEKMEESLTPEV